MPEWSNGAVSKTVDRLRGPWVRIPPSPPTSIPPLGRVPAGRRPSNLRQKVKNREEDLSAQQSPPQEEARVPVAHAHPERSSSPGPAPPQGARTTDGLTGGSSLPFSSGSPAGPRVRTRIGEAWRPEHRLRRRPDYIRCYRTGRRVEAAGLRLYVARGEGAGARFGITASRKVGRAVVRQRTRRRVREILRRWSQRDTLPALDLVVHLHPSAASLSFDELRVSLEGALERARDLAAAPDDAGRSGARPSSSRRRSRQ